MDGRPLRKNFSEGARGRADGTLVSDMSDTTFGSSPGSDERTWTLPADKRPPGPLRGLHILVVDDNRDTREMLRQILTHAGALVTIVGDGADAVAVVRNISADVVISDLAMPVHDGQWVIQNVRALGGRAGRIPAIAVTAYRESETEAAALAAGFDAYLEKPFDFPRLIETILRLVSSV